MMTFEALFSLLALLIVVAMMAQPSAQCAGDVVYGQRLAQDVANVLAKKGTLDEFAEWAGGEAAATASLEDDLHGVAAVSGMCVRISANEKSAVSCAGWEGRAGTEAVVYSTKRIVVLKGGFADVHVSIWEAGQ